MTTQAKYQGIIHRYRDKLPVSEQTPVVTLYEGNTPLIPLLNIEKTLHKKVIVYAKYEGLNPSGSFKDRGMSVAISKAVEENKRAVICASTGNTSAAAASYAARAKIKCFILIPEGKIALGKLAQSLIHGANVIQIRGNFDQGLQLAKDLTKSLPLTMVNSLNPFRLQGQKTAAFEIVEQLGKSPDFHCLPVGNAANIVANWMGYQEYGSELPKMIGYQADGAAPFVKGSFVEEPDTIATAIRIGKPQSWEKARETQQISGGWFASVSDDKILAAQQQLAQLEGIFAEPAACASIAGLIEDVKQNKIPDGSTVVCTLTGHGLKDPDIVMQKYTTNLQVVDPILEDVRKIIVEQL